MKSSAAKINVTYIREIIHQYIQRTTRRESEPESSVVNDGRGKERA